MAWQILSPGAYGHNNNREENRMNEFYKMTGEEVMMEVNGSTEPLSDGQIAANREKYGPNELAEGKKKSTVRIICV